MKPRHNMIGTLPKRVRLLLLFVVLLFVCFVFHFDRLPNLYKGIERKDEIHKVLASSVQFSFKMVSMRSEKPICAPPRPLRCFPNVYGLIVLL